MSINKSMTFILTILAIFAFCSAFSAEEQMAGGAHLLGDRFSNPADWSTAIKGPAYKVDMQKWGGRCLSDLHCDGERKCSFWGWCQEKEYNGPVIR